MPYVPNETKWYTTTTTATTTTTTTNVFKDFKIVCILTINITKNYTLDEQMFSFVHCYTAT